MSGNGWLRRAAGWLGLAAAAGMLVVLVMGATVTTTGSAQGCGRDWPLCKGRLVPDFALATAIEFSHRAVTGVEGVLIVAFTIVVLVLYRSQRPALFLAPLMLGSLLLQAGMGAWAVKYPQQPVVLALHFGISLIALASVTLTALYVRRTDEIRRSPAVWPGLRLATWGITAYLYLLVYSGAYIRHVGAAGACTSWPVCGSGSGDATGVAVNLAHRAAALTALLLAAALLIGYRWLEPARRDLLVGACILIATLLLQGAAGAFLVFSHYGLSAELLHAGLTGVVFTAAAYLCLRVTVGAHGEESARWGRRRSRLRAEGVR
ncbi:MAG: COX15/CtaA family protein [Candidatus Dormibacteraeota bacterium]|nr:COX15/CtaA family protein [Candidatus Dormibacteraeota bacterium]